MVPKKWMFFYGSWWADIMYGALSSPLTFSDNFEKNLDIAYEYFQGAINDRSKRPALFDKQVFIEAHEKIDGRPEGFWHVVSLETTHQFKVLPCVNDGNINLCGQNCNNNNHQVSVKYGVEVRNLCLLRASRLPWIVDIITLANKNDPSVEVWLKPSTGKSSDKLYLRYNQDGADYVIIFSDEKHHYRLISAFPVFYIREKEQFSKDYKKFAWSYFSK